MQIPVVIEPIAAGQFRASGVAPFTSVAEGKTSDEALANLRGELEKEVRNGKQVVLLNVGDTEVNPWLAIAGSLKDSPLFDEWQAAIREYRHQCDIEAGIQRSRQE
jgi:hypothetical protein